MPGGFDPFAYAGDLTRSEVVPHDHLAGLNLLAEHVIERGKDFGIDGGLDHNGEDPAAHAHRAQDGKDRSLVSGVA